ncbi:RagB/SusD family nutrient uptake outer membrane protein [Marinilongibacter aquaticus]|uniref:RagB/SusD family nutrient uptake outer membrane protein n=1 Tax=Marinilongibacter aquaticus TaxID=2975157 RepID=UPI0021BD093F|nr:RagB/SusD family nutrient uptake outer membrane protein [Marinilongibacter aquaticus]UBM58772.1 RagB/SusD family nutrient uptake outer membrane protein [Marinilongibacter aquaticus]
MKKLLVSILLCHLLASCGTFLDRKPDKTLVVPSSVEDLQALLNDTYTFTATYPGSGEIAAADFYLDTPDWLSISQPSVRNAYVWGTDMFNEHERNEWSVPYITVYSCNVILDALAHGKIASGSRQEKDRIQGSALFFRSWTFYQLLQLFAKAWDPRTAGTDPGIALRLDPDPNLPSTRASVRACYDRLTGDLEDAAGLLPEVATLRTMPTRQAALALLARVHLTVGAYAKALEYADLALGYPHGLLDFNLVDGSPQFPFTRYNREVLLHSMMATTGILYPPTQKVDTLLLGLYEENDLRKDLFYRPNADGSHSFRGSYDGTATLFNGLSLSELYLIRAECLARSGQAEAAMISLNTLLASRYRTGTFMPLPAVSAERALKQILTERRKELAFRGVRWSDLKRLNREAGLAVTLRRTIDGKDYVLAPNDDRYVFPLPESVVQMTGMEQNP